MKTLVFNPASATVKESLEGLIRDNMRLMLDDILQEELARYLEEMSGKTLADGRASIVRNGYHRERTLQTGLGPVEVHVPRTRNRAGDRENFQSAIIPRYKRRSATLEKAICFGCKRIIVIMRRDV